MAVVSDSEPPRPAAALSRRSELMALLTAVVTPAALVGVYALMPMRGTFAVSGVALAVLSPFTAAGLLVWQIRRIRRSPAPVARAFASLIVTFSLLILGAACAYLTLESADPGSFSEPLTKVGAAYFAVVTAATVGFGDITPVTDSARLLVTVHIVIAVVFAGGGVNLLLKVGKRNATRDNTADRIRG